MSKVQIGRAIIGWLYLPVSFFLTYLILAHIDATELMWFVWILLIPLGIALQMLEKIATGDE